MYEYFCVEIQRSPLKFYKNIVDIHRKMSIFFTEVKVQEPFDLLIPAEWRIYASVN